MRCIRSARRTSAGRRRPPRAAAVRGEGGAVEGGGRAGRARRRRSLRPWRRQDRPGYVGVVCRALSPLKVVPRCCRKWTLGVRKSTLGARAHPKADARALRPSPKPRARAPQPPGRVVGPTRREPAGLAETKVDERSKVDGSATVDKTAAACGQVLERVAPEAQAACERTYGVSPAFEARPAPPPRTKWTRRVPHPVLIGHAASLTPY